MSQDSRDVPTVDRRMLRVTAALLVTGLLWIAACVAAAVGLLFSNGRDFDGRKMEHGNIISVVALLSAAILFLGSGVVAYWIGRRRWLLALPAVGLWIWLMGIGLANAT